MFNNLLKPWFVWNPRQVLNRIVRRASNTVDDGLRKTAWGATLHVDPSQNSAKVLSQTGVYDLAVSEALARLIRPGDCVVDAGANIGSMSVLAGYCVGDGGRVIAFEPHPKLAQMARRNLATNGLAAVVELREKALSNIKGRTLLVMPEGYESNDGIGRLVRDDEDQPRNAVEVEVARLDDELAEQRIQVMKVDVEGFELQLFKGAESLLREHRLHHIVFEDHVGAGSEVIRYLQSHGYSIHALGWKLSRPVLGTGEVRRLAKDYEPPNYLASCRVEEATEAFAPIGWKVLRNIRRRPAAAGLRVTSQG